MAISIDNATFESWLPLFGLPSTDDKVRSLLADYGSQELFKLRPTWSSGGVDFKDLGFAVSFTSEFNLSGGSPKVAIVSGVIMKLMLGKTSKNWKTYQGPLPNGLKSDHSKEQVLNVLGTPETLSDDFFSGSWSIGAHEIGIAFTENWGAIKQLGLSLPNAV
jgi:hypothetical protein